jgi:predicted DNA binding CopG/RHH family protein
MTNFNPKEQKLLESIENDEWISIDNVEQEIQRFQTYAHHQLSEHSIKVNLSTDDLQKIQQLANQLGQSVSSLTHDILHKYLEGELIEKT